MTIQDQTLFTDTVWDYYAHHARDLPWRHLDGTIKEIGYQVLVSNLCYNKRRLIGWLRSISNGWTNYQLSMMRPVAHLQSSLGYGPALAIIVVLNTCNKPVSGCVRTLVACYRMIRALQQLKGIGPNTAAAIIVYTYNQPQIFVETNIRTVYIHHFFDDAQHVSDAELLPYITATVDKEHPRQWYWALMDYGSFLKKEYGNVAQRSSVYRPQSRFNGSRRQLRGLVVKQLLDGTKTISELTEHIAHDVRGRCYLCLSQRD